jgi:FkbM family methyltransferase
VTSQKRARSRPRVLASSDTKTFPERRVISGTMKQIIQSLLGAFGFRLVRLQNVPGSSLEKFFSVLKARGFTPKHIIDVGANHGAWTRCALQYFPKAYYTLVEPQDHLKMHVQDLLASNSKIRWIGAGAGDKPGTLPFSISYRDDSSSFIPTPGATETAGMRQIEVPVTTLNEIVRTSDAPFPDMIKIDAEGFDLRVLAGASKLVGKTDIFLLEATICAEATISQQNSENSLGNVIQAMAHADYRIIDITDSNRSPKYGVLSLCEVAFLRNGSRLLDGVTSYE